MQKTDFEKFALSRGLSSMTLDSYGKFNEKILGSYIEPSVLEERSLNVVSLSVFSRLMLDRIIFLGTPVDENTSNIISAQLLWLESVDPSKDVTMHVSSPGGSVYDGYKILDTMDFIKPDITTVSMGMVASMASVIASNGTRGKRFILPRSRFMIHQPLGGAHGQCSDILITAKEIEKVRNELYGILSKNSNLTIEEIAEMADRDCWMDAEEALKNGFVDTIINSN